MSLRTLCCAAGCVAALGALSAASVGQGPAYRERWGYLHLERRRAEVLDELQGRSAEDMRQVAALLVADDGGVPFRPLAEALAYLRGADADAAFQLRCALGLFVLPEVVDPDGQQAACRAANFSVCLPFPLPTAGKMTFEVVVRDGSGEVVFEDLLTKKTSIADVRLAQAEASVPCGALEDGVYEVELRAFFDGAGPREHDPTLRWPFHVLRGYQERAELAMGNAIALRETLTPLSRALLDGIASHVSRAYTGEAFAVRSDAVADLLRLERCVQNLAAGRAPLLGITGVVSTALPYKDSAQPCVLRANDLRKHRPTVVFASGAPTYGVSSRRPSAPVTRDAAWLLRDLGEFGRAEGWNLAVFDSPGGGRRYAEALLAGLAALPEVLPTGEKKPLLVCDREAASVVGIQLAKFRSKISGVVLVGAGGIPAQVIDGLDGLPVRYISLAAYPASGAIDRVMDYVAGRDAGDARRCDFGMLHQQPTPWPFGIGLAAADLTAWARELFGER